MLNYYRVTFSTGEYWELYSWKLLCRHYHMITSALIDNEEYLNGGHNIAKVYHRNTCVASFELFNWGDGTGDIYSDGHFLRHVSNLRVKEKEV